MFPPRPLADLFLVITVVVSADKRMYDELTRLIECDCRRGTHEYDDLIFIDGFRADNE